MESVETVNAAANAIVSAENRVQQVAVPRRRWKACFSVYWCFGSQRHGKRISHAVLVPEPMTTTTTSGPAPAPENQNHRPALSLPFIAPPSSPASFLPSGPSSSTQSPTGFLSFSASTYSPTGPSSIFAIGPYADERQLVSPPVFSTFTTEPSTAPFTPPPEPVQLTTPSSPEVPFAKLLTSSLDPNRKHTDPYEFPSYQLYPGSPIGHLISPSSGTSSPFPDTHSLHDGQLPAITTSDASHIRPPNDEPVMGHRVSFELSAQEVARCMEKKPTFSMEAAALGSTQDGRESMPEGSQFPNQAEGSHGHSASPAVAKEFKFNNPDGSDAEPDADWWVNGKVVGSDAGPQKNWAFFPMIQPGVG